MKQITLKNKENGELLVRDMSEKAQSVYYDSDPITVAKMYDGTISIRGIFGDYDDLSFEQAEKFFEDLADSMDEDTF